VDQFCTRGKWEEEKSNAGGKSGESISRRRDQAQESMFKTREELIAKRPLGTCRSKKILMEEKTHHTLHNQVKSKTDERSSKESGSAAAKRHRGNYVADNKPHGS